MRERLSFRGVSFAYPGTRVFRRLDLSVGEGEFVAVLGPNGCGKTTLVRLATRVVVPDAGEVALDGKNVRDLSAGEIARRVAVVPQEERSVFAFSAFESVLMGRTPWRRGLSFESARDREIARAALRAVEAEHLAERDVRELSGGEAQRVRIARALAQQTGFVVLDEPTSHLDLRHRVGILSLLAGLRASEGLTVLVISHDINLLVRFAERVVLLGPGEVVAEGAPAEVLDPGRLSRVYGTDVVVRRVEGIPVPQVYPEWEEQG